MNGGEEFPSIFPEDEKLFSRLSLREKRCNSSKQQQQGGEASFRVLYYGGGAGSVPFLWESQPGTPKHPLGDGPLPPLTPPPQHQSSPLANPSFKKKHSKIFNSIFARTPSKKSGAPPSPSTPLHGEKARLGSIRFEVEEDGYGVGRVSPTSTLCFRGRNEGSSCRRCKGYYGYPLKGVKKVVKSIAGHPHV